MREILRGLVAGMSSERYNASEFGVGERVIPDAVDGETGVVGNGGGGIKPPLPPLARVEMDVEDVEGWRVSGGGFFREDDDDEAVDLLFALLDRGVAPLRDLSK